MSKQQITAFVQWWGLADAATTLAMSSLVTTDEEIRKDFDERVVAITFEITSIQEVIVSTAITLDEKASLDKIVTARAFQSGQAEAVKQLKITGDVAGRQAFFDAVYKLGTKVYLDAIDKYVTLQARERDATLASALVAAVQ